MEKIIYIIYTVHLMNWERPTSRLQGRKAFHKISFFLPWILGLRNESKWLFPYTITSTVAMGNAWINVKTENKAPIYSRVVQVIKDHVFLYLLCWGRKADPTNTDVSKSQRCLPFQHYLTVCFDRRGISVAERQMTTTGYLWLMHLPSRQKF